MGIKTQIALTQDGDDFRFIGNYHNDKIYDFGAFLYKEGHIYNGSGKMKRQKV
jgi:hypothetical protein